jgi:hypothetical protein
MSQQAHASLEASTDGRSLARLAVQAARWSLVGLLLASIVAAVALHPREGSYNDLAAALKRDDVAAYTVTDRPTWLEPGPTMTPDEAAVAWRDRRGEIYVTDLIAADGAAANLGLSSLPAAVADSRADDLMIPPVDGGSGHFVRLAEARGLPHLDLTSNAAARLGRVLDVGWLLALALMLAHRQPRRATPWAWFWISTTTLGLGLLWWLLEERPWSQHAMAQPDLLPPRAQRRLPGGDPRVTGGFGLVFMVAASVTVWFGLAAIGR